MLSSRERVRHILGYILTSKDTVSYFLYRNESFNHTVSHQYTPISSASESLLKKKEYNYRITCELYKSRV